MTTKNNMALLAIAAGVALLAWNKTKTGGGGPPGRTGGPTKAQRVSVAIGAATLNNVPIVNGYPARPGAAAGAPSFAHDWGGQAALTKSVKHWIPILRKELRLRKSGDPFRARSARMLEIIDAYLRA